MKRKKDHAIEKYFQKAGFSTRKWSGIFRFVSKQIAQANVWWWRNHFYRSMAREMHEKSTTIKYYMNFVNIIRHGYSFDLMRKCTPVYYILIKKTLDSIKSFHSYFSLSKPFKQLFGRSSFTATRMLKCGGQFLQWHKWNLEKFFHAYIIYLFYLLVVVVIIVDFPKWMAALTVILNTGDHIDVGELISD